MDRFRFIVDFEDILRGPGDAGVSRRTSRVINPSERGPAEGELVAGVGALSSPALKEAIVGAGEGAMLRESGTAVVVAGLRVDIDDPSEH